MSALPLPRGVFPTMITPFTVSGEIDWAGADRLVHWYLDRGARGIFAVCGSSELNTLTMDERFALCERVAARASPAPVVASGTSGGLIGTQAADCRRMIDLGARAAVVVTSSLAGPEEPHAVWRARLWDLIEQTRAVPLGLYEMPGPGKRTIAPAMLDELAHTDRFLFYKDTTCDLNLIRAKTASVRGTPLSFYNANASSLLYSLRCGGAGFSGIAANFYPDLIAWLCDHWAEETELAERVQDVISALEPAIGRHYPLSAKLHLASLGLEPMCRTPKGYPSQSDLRTLEAAGHVADHMRKELELPT